MTTPAMDTPPTTNDGPRRGDDATAAPYESHYEKRPCENCDRVTKHLVTEVYAADGRRTGGFARCWECPPELLTAWLVKNGILHSVIVTDDQDVTVANRPLAYGNRGNDAADYALTALGFKRVSDWESVRDVATCRVQWV
ncbi:hypothetical protein [Haloactinopolyspora alba]|nr:hypothetical protein [Haloactinopolyspora alba]